MPTNSFAVIESYLDGCKFNEVGCGCRSPGANSDGMDELGTAGGTLWAENRVEGTGHELTRANQGPAIDWHVADKDGN